MPQHKKFPLVAFIGLPGSGKTTAAKICADNGYSLAEEDFINNAFLSKFYADQSRWAFHSQMYFLIAKIKQASELTRNLKKKPVAQDFPLLLDVAYAKTTARLGYMLPEEWELYFDTYLLLYKTITVPSVLVNLSVSPQMALERIKKRGRPYEQSITADYLLQLQTSIDELVEVHKEKIKIVTIPADELDLVSSERDKEYLLDLVREC